MADIRILTALEFRSLPESEDVSDVVVVHDSAPTMKSVRVDLREVDWTISTEDKDRYGDIIRVKGWDLENFQLTRSVLFAHDYLSPPVATAKNTEKRGKSLVSTSRFPPVGIYALSDTVFGLVQHDILRTTSVGLKAKKFQRMFDEDGNYLGIDFQEQELLEYSIVPVPANPKALKLMLEKAAAERITLAPIRQWCEDYLDGDHGLAIVPRKQVEDVCAHLRSPRIWMPAQDVVPATFAVPLTSGFPRWKLTWPGAETTDDSSVTISAVASIADDEQDDVDSHGEMPEAGDVVDLDEAGAVGSLSEDERAVLDRIADGIHGLGERIEALEKLLTAPPAAPAAPAQDAKDNLLRFTGLSNVNDLRQTVEQTVRQTLDHELVAKTGRLPKEE